eukprot:TRINITY_DN11975_c0_g1_i1.p1 TRINITY_DN11975_c0_g1~~TRINITY_DN11975_c0_g1_i1.p1  ORF type:complete len:202 (-),score=57.55 TRINITY_DN11975_c0_g1_i1:78-611(-)
MGAQSSVLRQEEIEEMQTNSNFSQTEIKRLYKRFRKLDKDNSGTISTDEFLMIPELATNPLVQRVIAIFDANKDDNVNFKEFITSLSVFSVKGDKNEKLHFAFKVYDIDNDGFISNGELFQVLKMMVGNNLTDVQLQQIVDKTILEADLDKDGRISFDEFSKILENADLETKMTIRF